MLQMQFRQVVTLCLFLSIAGCASSSSEPALTTYPVTGKLLDQEGKPVTQGMLEFSMMKNDLPKTATAELGPDGTFSLTSFNAEGTKFSGAEPGEYRVTYYPPMSAAQTEAPIILSKLQVVEAKPNEIALQLE